MNEWMKKKERRKERKERKKERRTREKHKNYETRWPIILESSWNLSEQHRKSTWHYILYWVTFILLSNYLTYQITNKSCFDVTESNWNWWRCFPHVTTCQLQISLQFSVIKNPVWELASFKCWRAMASRLMPPSRYRRETSSRMFVVYLLCN